MSSAGDAAHQQRGPLLILSVLLGLLFLLVIAVEVGEVFVYGFPGNFILDPFFRREKEALRECEDADAVASRMEQVSRVTPIVWRQAVSFSAVVAVFTYLFLTLTYPCIPVMSMIHLFLVVFFVSILLFCLINYHTYGMKDDYVRYGLQLLRTDLTTMPTGGESK